MELELTAQDLRILRLKAYGKSADTIAGLIGLSPSAVKARLPLIYKKLGARNDAEAAKIAEQRGLLLAHPPPALDQQFTERELKIGQEVANGLSNAQIAKKLKPTVPKITVFIVQNDIASLLAKTGGENRADLARRLTAMGLVQ